MKKLLFANSILLTLLLTGCNNDGLNSESNGENHEVALTADEIHQYKYGFPTTRQPMLEANNLLPEKFKINNSKDTTIIGKKGTIISIPANSFEVSNDSEINFELIEAPELKDILLLNAQTISDDKMLETDGVVYVQAFQNNKKVKVKAKSIINIKIPSKKINKEMVAFTGTFNDEGEINWKENNTMSFEENNSFNDLVINGMFEIPFSHFPYKEEYLFKDSIAKVYPDKGGELVAPVANYLISKDKAKFYKKVINIINSNKYKNTYFATREFAERLYRLQYHDHTYHYPNFDGKGNCSLAWDEFAPFQHKALDIFKNSFFC